MLVADSLGRCESCLCDGVYLFSLQRLSHQECAPPNERVKLACRGGHFWRNKSFLIVAAPPRTLSTIR